MEEKEEKLKKEKGNHIMLIVINIIITLIIVVTIEVAKTSFARTSFDISDFTLESDEYEYLEEVYYEGKGIITTRDKSGIYIVALKSTLLSGGDQESTDDKEQIEIVLVEGGKGKFSTYDSGKEEKISKPEYDFKIVGYQKLN